ncbi:cytochrome c oxidase subunit IV [Dictyocaulus viviparus]|uniref:Cytochrome c oxidase subunit 4 n=1 Tax=Dictyocaulus viviparus TaxID=29172 RepID=A0A0D8XZ48_DICVI|nr:cytochrome c oxidase subunit IV [Dictyocaulus viviparus]
MLLRSLVLPRLTVRSLKTSAPTLSGHHIEHWWGPEKAAGREYVGFGFNGDYAYVDRLDYWYPSIRFRKDDDTIRPIRKKELGDWKNLSLEDKKLLYRYSFKQTLAEFEAPSGYWKVVLACVLSVISLATLYATFISVYVFPEIPGTFQDEYKEAELKKTLVLRKGDFLGAPKYYDYENDSDAVSAVLTRFVSSRKLAM